MRERNDWKRRLRRLTGGALATMLVVPALGLLTTGAAQAGDAPQPPVGAFNAPKCAGASDIDPTDVNPAFHHGYTDLTEVSGARLTSYNNGNAVPLYDNFGEAYETYPPLCATYYDPETNSAQSVWMFCTDVLADTCGDIGPGGTLNNGADDVGELTDQANNPRLTEDQERLIAWLLTHGYDYTATGLNDNGATRADQTNSANRSALQNLIWCVSDPDLNNSDFQEMCESNFPPAEQSDILSRVPGTAVVHLSLTAAESDVVVGKRRVITVRTNVFNQPIRLEATGTAAGSLSVCGGPGTLAGNDLTVAGTDPDHEISVDLCLTPSEPGSYGLNASADAVQSDHLQWAQAASECQVFARFRHDAGAPVSASVDFAIVEQTQKRSKPRLVTKSSAQVARPGARLFDKVKIKNFVPGHGAIGKAVLYGPVAKVTKKVCTPANRVATVRFTPRNGVVRTPRIKVTEPGYYTWIARTSADSHNKAARHRCGLAEETTLVRKRPYRVTTVAAGYSGPAPTTAHRAVAESVSIPAARVQGPVTAVPHRDGRMLLPADAARVGRLTSSAKIGDKIGTTVLGGHVSSRLDSPGALWHLNKVRRGQILTYRFMGEVHRYRVTGVHRYSRDKALPARLFRTTGKHRLVVISCTDKITHNGRWHYVNNLVITAKPIR